MRGERRRGWGGEPRGWGRVFPKRPGGWGGVGQASASEPRAGGPGAPPGWGSESGSQRCNCSRQPVPARRGAGGAGGRRSGTREPGACRVPVPAAVPLSLLPAPAVAALWFSLCSLSAPAARNPQRGRGQRSKPTGNGEHGSAGGVRGAGTRRCLGRFACGPGPRVFVAVCKAASC